MERLENKYTDLLDALYTFKNSIAYYQQTLKKNPSLEYPHLDMIQTFRDSVIQRFEYCYELKWKYVACYLEVRLQANIEIYAPSHIFRKACFSKLISEQEAAQALQMVKDLNQTSHIYKEEIADYIAKQAENYYDLMHSIAQRLKMG